jgi:hypothetical protein
MRFTVIWYASAQRDLARIWLAAIERQAVTVAADSIDKTLRDHAETAGVEFQGWRLLHVPPLAVVFRVDLANRQVHVRQVWRDATNN